MMPAVVCNTGPVIALASIDRLEPFTASRLSALLAFSLKPNGKACLLT